MKDIKSPVQISATTIAVALLFLTTAVKAQYYVGAGLSNSHSNGSGLSIQKELGYQVHVGTLRAINETNYVGSEIQFISHRNNIEINDDQYRFRVKSINLAFFYKVYPIKNIWLSGGALVGFYARPRVNHIDPVNTFSSHAGVLASAGVDIQKFSIYTRVTRYLTDDRMLDSGIQLGLNYNL